MTWFVESYRAWMFFKELIYAPWWRTLYIVGPSLLAWLPWDNDRTASGQVLFVSAISPLSLLCYASCQLSHLWIFFRLPFQPFSFEILQFSSQILSVGDLSSSEPSSPSLERVWRYYTKLLDASCIAGEAAWSGSCEWCSGVTFSAFWIQNIFSEVIRVPHRSARALYHN